MAKKKSVKLRNPIARQLFDPRFRAKTVGNKKKYNRKRDKSLRKEDQGLFILTNNINMLLYISICSWKEKIVAYKLVEGSHGSAPRFAITLGLQEGYQSGVVRDVKEVVQLVGAYLEVRAAKHEPYLTGTVSSGTLVYAWRDDSRDEGVMGTEPQAVFSGNYNPLYNANLDHTEVVAILNDMAGYLGEKLKQTRVYVEFAGDMWVLQREGQFSPREQSE